MLSAFDDWLKHVEAESVVGIENEADDEEREVLQKYSEFRKLSRTFARKWTDFRRSDVSGICGGWEVLSSINQHRLSLK